MYTITRVHTPLIDMREKIGKIPAKLGRGEHKEEVEGGDVLFCPSVPLLFDFVVLFCVVLAVLELTPYTKLASNSEIHVLLPPKCWD